MADKKEGKKKGGKMPIILVAVLVLAGGGFFAMNGSKKTEEPEEEPEVKLGAVVKLGDEIIVNLKDGKTFLVTQISVQTEEGAHVTDPAGGGGKDDHGGGDKGGSYSVARDAINQVLSHKSIEDITKPGAMKYLKRELAAAMNHNLHASHPPEKGEKKKKKKKKDEEEHGHAEIDHEWLDEIGMDAEEGPVLKVFFDEFMFTK